VIVVSAAMSACSPDRTRSTQPSGTPTTSVVKGPADSQRPLLVYAEPALAPPDPLCEASQVNVAFVREHHAVGHDWLSFRLTNAAPVDCQLAGDPVVTARLSGFEPVAASRGLVVGGWPDAGPAATLPPGGSANLSVISNVPCQREWPSPVPAGLPPATVDLELPGGVTQLPIPETVRDPFRPNGTCSFSVAGFERFRPVVR
jgi:hypothetical protein